MGSSIGEFDLAATRDSPDPCCFAYKAVRRGTNNEVELRVTGGCDCALGCFNGTTKSLLPGDHHSRLKSLEHPNLLRIRELDADAGCILYTTDIRQATPLEEYLERAGGFLEAEAALDLMLPLGEGIAQLHKEGVIHGDLGPQAILVEETTERAYLATMPVCGVLGLPGLPACDPSRSSTCPMESVAKKHWPPIPALDIEGFGALVYFALTGGPLGGEGPGESALHPGIREIIQKSQETPREADNPARLEDLLEALRMVRKTLHRQAVERRSKAARLRHEGAQKKLDRRDRLRRAGDRVRRQELEARQRTLASRFARMGSVAQAAVFFGIAMFSSQLPLEDLIAPPTSYQSQGTRPQIPTKNDSPQTPKPPPATATATAPPTATQAAKPKLLGRNPEETKFLNLADQTWEKPTSTQEVFGTRYQGVWDYFKSLPRLEREELGDRGTLTTLKKVAHRDPYAGYRKLDELVLKCQEHIKRKVQKS